MMRLNASIVPPTPPPAWRAASGIFSKSLSSPTQRNLPCSHWASKSCLKFLSAIGGYCIASLPFRQLPAAKHEQYDKTSIHYHNCYRKERSGEIERLEGEKADGKFNCGEYVQACRFFMRSQVGLAVCWSKNDRIRNRYDYNSDKRVTDYSP